MDASAIRRAAPLRQPLAASTCLAATRRPRAGRAWRLQRGRWTRHSRELRLNTAQVSRGSFLNDRTVPPSRTTAAGRLHLSVTASTIRLHSVTGTGFGAGGFAAGPVCWSVGELLFGAITAHQLCHERQAAARSAAGSRWRRVERARPPMLHICRPLRL